MTDTPKQNCAHCGRDLTDCQAFHGIAPGYPLAASEPKNAYCDIECWLIDRSKVPLDEEVQP